MSKNTGPREASAGLQRGEERESWLVDVGKKAKAGVDRGLMLAGQARSEEEEGGVAAKPASDHEGEKAEAAAGATASTEKRTWRLYSAH